MAKVLPVHGGRGERNSRVIAMAQNVGGTRQSSQLWEVPAQFNVMSAFHLSASGPKYEKYIYSDTVN